jgi:hypothetical protein
MDGVREAISNKQEAASELYTQYLIGTHRKEARRYSLIAVRYSQMVYTIDMRTFFKKKF